MGNDSIARGMAANLPLAETLRQQQMLTRGRFKTDIALGRVLAGEGRMSLVCVGDSTTAGNISVRQDSWPNFLAAALARMGVPATSASIFGAGIFTAPTAAAYMAYNPEVVLESGWAFNAGVRSVGGPVFSNTTTTNKLIWTPAVPWNKGKLFTMDGNTGTIAYDIAGGSATNVVNSSATHTFKTVNLDSGGAAAEQALGIARVSGTANFIGAYVWDDAVPGVDILNVGCGSITTGGYADTGFPWRPGSALTGLAGDLYNVSLGINDSLQSIARATMQASLNTIAGLCRAAGDCWIGNHSPINTDNVNYDLAYAAVAKANNCSFLDINGIMGGSYTAMSGAGLSADGNHPDRDGNMVWAGAIARKLLV